MKFESDDLKTTFEVPDKPTYRDMMRYDATEWRIGSEIYERLWLGVCAVAQNWQSELIPEATPTVFEQDFDPQAYEVIKWAGLAVFSWAQKAKELPKNS